MAVRPRGDLPLMSACRRLTGSLLALGVLATTACSSTVYQAPLTFKKNVQLPADTGQPSVDLLTLDPRRGRLYVPHGSTNSLDMLDLSSERLVGSVPGLSGVRATALISDPAFVFTSNSGDGTVSVVDVAAMKVVATINVGGSPDAIAYDPVHDLVVVSLGSDNAVGFIDPTGRKLLGKLDVPGKPELMAVDTHQGLVYLAINTKDEVVTIDPLARSVVKTYKGCDIKAPSGVAYDPDQQRLFVAGKREVSVIDVLLDGCLGAVDTGSGPDQIAFNAHTHHLYTANAGSRNVSVIDTVSLKPLGVVGTGPDAATIAVDSSTDKVYVAVGRAGIVAIFHDP